MYVEVSEKGLEHTKNSVNSYIWASLRISVMYNGIDFRDESMSL